MKKFAFFALAALISASFVGCDDGDDNKTNDKKANGVACAKADECTSGYCDAETNKCAAKPAGDDKKADGADCAKADECTSGYCDAETNKCAANPAGDDKKADGADCAKADDCTSGYCDAETNKCAAKPAESTDTIDSKIEAFCKAVAEQEEKTNLDECISFWKEELSYIKEKMPDCAKAAEDSLICQVENIGSDDSEDACTDKDEAVNSCMQTKYFEEYYMMQHKIFCDNVDPEEEPEDADPEVCIAAAEDNLKTYKETYSKCYDTFKDQFICWENCGDDDDTCDTTCNAKDEALSTCLVTEYFEEYYKEIIQSLCEQDHEGFDTVEACVKEGADDVIKYEKEDHALCYDKWKANQTCELLKDSEACTDTQTALGTCYETNYPDEGNG